MKKIFFAIFAFSLLPLFAELYPARRYVELGVGANAMAAQDGMPLTEIFKKHLVLDLKKIQSGMNKSGLTLALSAQEDFHLDFNFRTFGVGLRADSEFNANFNITKDLFDVLDGVKPGSVYKGEANFWIQSFSAFSIPIRFNVNKWKVTITPACFVPCVYVPATTVRGKAVNGVDGTVTVSASAPLEIYTISEFKGLIKDGDFSTDFVNKFDSSALASDIATSAGVDLGAAAEYALTDELDIGGYIRTPLYPGHLRHKITATATVSVSSDSLLKMIVDERSPDSEAKLSDAVYSSASYVVNRPFKLGVECAWRPVGKWLTLRGALGMGLRNPFGQDVSIKSLYPEYRFGAEVVGIGMFGIGLSTAYTQKVFSHGLDLMLNFRAVEFDFSAAVCSPSFIQSFKGEGALAGVAVKFGW